MDELLTPEEQKKYLHTNRLFNCEVFIVKEL